MKLILFILFMGANFPSYGIKHISGNDPHWTIKQVELERERKKAEQTQREQENREQRKHRDRQESEEMAKAEAKREKHWRVMEKMEKYIALLLTSSSSLEKREKAFKKMKSIIEDDIDINYRFSNALYLSLLNVMASAPTNRGVLMMEFLVSKGADINSRDHLDRTPLHNAVIASSPEHVQFLLEKGANQNAKDIYEHTPFIYNTSSAPLFYAIKTRRAFPGQQLESDRRKTIVEIFKQYWPQEKKRRGPFDFCRMVFKK